MRRAWTALLWHLAVIGLGAALVASVRWRLWAEYERHPHVTEQVSLLLSPEHTVISSLGHREALADYLFANLLVQYGRSFQERSRFEPTYKYLDTVTTLAPTFERPYMYADTLLTMRATPAVLEDYLAVRRLHERGLQALPFHSELWSVAGQFAAYLAQQFLPAEYKKEFKMTGARYLARACELASNNANIPYHCITAARILNRAGQREAVIHMLSRTLAVNDDPQIRKLALRFLQRAVGEREQERQVARLDVFEAAWKKQLPHASRIMVSLLGPGPEVWACAGVAASGQPACATAWREWGERSSAPPQNVPAAISKRRASP